MELIIGGANQGMLAYAKKKYGFKKRDVWDLAEGLPEEVYPCYDHLEAVTGEWPDADEIIRLLTPYIAESVVISREIGSSIVPMEAEERVRRERHCIALAKLAKEADHVTRVFNGFEEKLK